MLLLLVVLLLLLPLQRLLLLLLLPLRHGNVRRLSCTSTGIIPHYAVKPKAPIVEAFYCASFHSGETKCLHEHVVFLGASIRRIAGAQLTDIQVLEESVIQFDLCFCRTIHVLSLSDR